MEFIRIVLARALPTPWSDPSSNPPSRKKEVNEGSNLEQARDAGTGRSHTGFRRPGAKPNARQFREYSATAAGERSTHLGLHRGQHHARRSAHRGWRSYVERFAARVRFELKRGRDVVINTGISGNRMTNLVPD